MRGNYAGRPHSELVGKLIVTAIGLFVAAFVLLLVQAFGMGSPAVETIRGICIWVAAALAFVAFLVAVWG